MGLDERIYITFFKNVFFHNILLAVNIIKTHTYFKQPKFWRPV